MAGFRPDLPVRAHSGGTVRDFHTVPYSSGAANRRAGHCKTYRSISPLGGYGFLIHYSTDGSGLQAAPSLNGNFRIALFVSSDCT